MAASWLFLQILMMLFYKNLHEFKKVPTLEVTKSKDVSERTCLLNESINDTNSTEQHDQIKQETLDNVSHHSSNATYQNSIRIIDNSDTGPLIVRFYNDYIRDEVVAVFFTTFTVIFMQTSLETFLTPFTRDYFGWTDAGNSLLYAVCGVEIMLVFLMLSFISKLVSDRILMIIGIVGNLTTLVFLIIWLPAAVPHSNQIKDYLCFGIPIFFNVFSLPLIVLPTISLLSKVTDIKSQGVTQGLRNAFSGVGQIFGPNWAGNFFLMKENLF